MKKTLYSAMILMLVFTNYNVMADDSWVQTYPPSTAPIPVPDAAKHITEIYLATPSKKIARRGKARRHNQVTIHQSLTRSQASRPHAAN
jgi:hypothetical protein